MNRILWIVFELFINIFQGFAFCFYSYKYLSNKGDKGFIKSSGVLFSFLLASVITFFNYVTFFEHLWALLYSGVIFLYAFFKLRGSIVNKILSSIIPILIMIISSAFISNFYSVLFGMTLEEILSQNSFPRFIAILSTQIMIVYLLMISLKLFKKNENNSLNLKEGMLIFSVLLISIIISTFLNLISLQIRSIDERYFIVLSFLGIVIINILVFYIVVDLSKMNTAIRENEVLKLKQEYSQQYITSANSQYEVIKKLRHDFKNNMAVVNELIQQKNNEKALEYTKEYLDELSETEPLIKTNNDIVNAIINSKLSAAKTYGINVICMCVTDFSDINDVDLCSLLSNILDNAITACKNCQIDSKRIFINIISDEYKYVFCVKNSIPESVLQHNPDLITTKSDKDNHGMGVKIIRSIAAKYDGKVDYYEEDKEFCCSVILKRKL